MPSPLLKTKLLIPPARPELVARPRLLTRLNKGLARPLTLLSAPPGFGKTTLLVDWLSQQPLPAAWYSLDESDNDLARFLTYLVGALEHIQPDAGQVVNRLRSRKKPALESVMTPLSNALAEIQHAFLLVLDDYHLITLPLIHEALAFLLEQLPPPLHLVIATRQDPPLPLARLRARGQLVELRAPELRFTPEEATQFLNERMGLNLTPPQVATLDARTEGWIAGLQLAALSVQGRQDIAGFLDAFTGSNSFVLDYLAEEVLQRQSHEIQTFLLQTSILDQINGSLCDAVTGRTDSAQVLTQLEKANLFLIPLDDARQWYRYHHLFADLLRNRLQQLDAGEIPALHSRASAWYEQNGDMNEAVTHARAALDYERAARLVEQVGLTLVMRSEYTTLLGWIAGLPDSVLAKRPFLRLIHAAALLMVGQIELGAARLAEVDDTALDSQARTIASILRPGFALLRTDMPEALALARRALEEAEAATLNPADPYVELNTAASAYMSILLAELELAAGELHAAAATCRRGLELGKAIAVGSPWELILGYIHYALAELLYEWNDIDAAAQRAAAGLEICRRIGNEEIESYALVMLAQIRQAQGDGGSASELLRQSLQLGHKRSIASEMRYVALRQVQVLLLQGQIEDAARLSRELPGEGEIAWFMERGLVELARALILIAGHEFARAEELLGRLQLEGQPLLQSGSLVEALSLLALAQSGQGHAERATATLRRALALARPEGYVRSFVDLAEPMRLLIQETRSQLQDSNLSAYAAELLAAFPTSRSAANLEFKRNGLAGSPSGDAAAAAGAESVLESLTDRELVVLRLIEQGLSNQEIADRLVVAVSTVKTHINRIYGKLGVTSRTQALARAHRLKLL